MRRGLLILTLAFVSTGLWAQGVSPRERKSENSTEAKSGIRDRVDVVAGPSVDQVTQNSAVLHWKTNKNAATRVNYGLDPNHMTQKAYKAGGSVEHTVTLNNLKPHQTYYYEIENREGKDRLNGNFTTH